MGMLATKAYEETAIGAIGTMTFGGLISVGVSADDSGYERFATEVAALEEMERDGRVQIESRHHESSTGARHVDMVRFTRLM